MKTVIKGLLVTLLLAITASAVGHGEQWDGHGFGRVVDMKQIETATGMMIHQTSHDFWDWTVAPKGFPKAVTATCHISIAMGKDGTPYGA